MLIRESLLRATLREGGLYMLLTKNRFTRNPYFHFHPMHSAFSLIGALVLLALLLWMFILVPPVR